MKMCFLVVLIFFSSSCGKENSKDASHSSKLEQLDTKVRCAESVECSYSCKSQKESCQVNCPSRGVNPSVTFNCQTGCEETFSLCIISACESFCTSAGGTYDEFNDCMASCQ